jgi:hypothetical protein
MPNPDEKDIVDETAAVVERLRALSNLEHDDLSIGDEAADLLERLSAQDDILNRLKDSSVVHVNMLRGGIAKLSVSQFLHTLGLHDTHVLVPREPDADMAEVARDWAQRDWNSNGDPKGYLKFYQGIYRAMINAVPKPDTETE